jgi:uncharacterized cupin superfamily protein
MTESFSITRVDGLELADGTPKPTSLTGQTESFTDLWVSPDSRLEMGVWECTPGTFTATRNGYDEIAHIVFGTATVTDSHGVVTELSPGTVFVTPEGWAGTWVVHELMRKTYTIRHHSA